jgi:cysteine sulfinate desulfinase/cysteine desulfurase-like protein
LRLTIGRTTTVADVEQVIADVVDVVAKLRG